LLLWFVFAWSLMMLNIFLFAFWPFIYLLQRHVCLSSLPIFIWVVF
jgi:hypothetical protein